MPPDGIRTPIDPTSFRALRSPAQPECWCIQDARGLGRPLSLGPNRLASLRPLVMYVTMNREEDVQKTLEQIGRARTRQHGDRRLRHLRPTGILYPFSLP